METVRTASDIALKEADSNVAEFLRLQSKKAAIAEQMKAYQEKLEKFAKENKNLKDKNGNINLATGYLHFGKKSVAEATRKFNLLRFIENFPELLKREFKVGAINAIMKDSEGKKKMAAMGIKIKKVPTFTIESNGTEFTDNKDE